MGVAAERWILAAALLGGCGGDDPGSGKEQPQEYTRPAVDALAGLVREPRGGAPARTGALDAIRRGHESLAGKALWKAVDKAEANGLHELYGAELFGGDASYQALFLVRTGDICACLYADAELHEQRDDPSSVPSYPLARTVFERMRERVGVHLPLEPRVELGWPAVEGNVVLIHVLRDGQSTAILWHAPVIGMSLAEKALLEFRADYAVDAILRALWAGLPAALFPKPEQDAAEVYSAAPGY